MVAIPGTRLEVIVERFHLLRHHLTEAIHYVLVFGITCEVFHLIRVVHIME